MMSVRHVEPELDVRIRRPKRTERARSCRARVNEVSACKSDVRVHVGAAAEPHGWLDRHELGGHAGDQLLANR